jgi:hypothetical protein
MGKVSSQKPIWVTITRIIFPFYLLAIAGDILFHSPPYKVAGNNSDLTYQWFGLILGLLPFLLLLVLGTGKALQLLPLSSRNLLNSIGLLTLFAACILKNAFTLSLLLIPTGTFSNSVLLMFFQTIIVMVKWTGFGLFIFPATLRNRGSASPSEDERKKYTILMVLTIILFTIAAWLFVIDIRGIFMN